MNRIVTAALIAAATTAASWAVRRWLDDRYAPLTRRVRPPLESWENEGGALAPHHVAIETSQVPR
jgi:hypothetical protein